MDFYYTEAVVKFHAMSRISSHRSALRSEASYAFAPWLIALSAVE